MFRTTLAVAVGLAIATPVLAETSVSLEVLRKYEMTDDLGNPKVFYDTVSKAVPGETVIYRITLENNDDRPATSVGLTLPIDPNILIDPASVGSELSSVATFSVDGAESFDAFSKLTVNENGTLRAAEAGDLTHVQIGIAELPAGALSFVEYSATVE